METTTETTIDDTIAKGNNTRGPIAENTNGNSTTPPTKPSGDTSEMPEMGEMGEPPEGFDGEMPEIPEMGEMPETSEGIFGQGSQGGGRGEFLSQSQNADSVLHPVGYLALGAGSLLLSTIIIYACFSKFFHKKPGQTFSSGAKFAWFVVATVVLTAGFITLCYFIPIWAS